MSKILTQWLKQDVGFPATINPTELDQEFSTGYNFGKLLSILGVQDDFEQHYLPGNATEVLIKNYISLESTLRQKLGIKLSGGFALDLINNKPGSTTKLLYQIKSALEILPKDHFTQSKKIFKKKPKFDSYPSSPVEGESTNLNIKENPVLPYDLHSVDHFATILKSNLKRAEFQYKKSTGLVVEMKKKELPPIPKATARPKPKVELPVAKPMSALSDLEIVKPIPGKAKIPDIKMIQDISNRIETFEHRLFTGELKKVDSNEDLIETRDSKSDVVQFIKTKSNMDPSLHLKELRKIVNDPNFNTAEETKQYIEKIRIHRQETENSRKEREKQRKKILLSCQNIQQSIEKERLDELIQGKLLRQSKQERRIAEQLLHIRHEKEVIHENYIYREQQYAAQRQKEYEEALEREHQLYLNTQGEYRQHVFMQIEQHREIMNQKKALKHERNTKFVEKIVEQILQLSFKVVDFKVLNDKKDVPPKIMRDWKTIFVNSVNLESYKEIPLEMDCIPKTMDEDANESKDVEVPEAVKILDKEEFNEYLNYNGNWAAVEENLVKKNDILAQAVEDVIKLTSQPPQAHQTVPLPAVPLRIAIIGKRYSGKKTLANAIATTYNMKVIRLDDLVKEAIAIADITVKKVKEKPSSGDKKLSKQQIGARLQLTMMEGLSPDDSLLVSLVVEAMSQEPEKPGGYVLVDFPKTRQQAQLLEREISGYEDPKPIKKGDLKRTKEKGNSGPKNRSLVAPYDNSNESSVSAPISGLDAVLLLNVSNEVAVKRAVGKFADPITDKRYHIEYNPPPTDQPGTFERLVQEEDQARAMNQLQYHLAAFEEEEDPLKEWIGQFKTLRVIDANVDEGEVKKASEVVLNPIISKINEKEKEKENAIAEEGEAGKLEANSNFQSEMDLAIKPRDTSSARKDRIQSPSEAKRAALKVGGDLPKKSKLGSEAALQTLGLGSSVPEIQPVERISTHIVRKTTSAGRKLPSKELAEILMNRWNTIESTYTEILKFTFRSIRRLKQDSYKYFYDTKAKFSEFLKRPDNEQDLIETFQQEYNAIEEDFRSDPDVKAELHQRVEELREKLWDIADKRRDEAESERISIIEDRWVEDQSYILANIYISMIQAEADKYLSTRQFLLDYFKDAYMIPFAEQTKSLIKIPIVAATANPPIEVGGPMIAASEAISSHRKDVVQSQTTKETTKTPAKTAKEKGGSSKNAPAAKAAIEAAAKPAPPQAEKEVFTLDPESTNFAEIQAALDFLYQALATSEFSLEVTPPDPPKDKKSNNVEKDETEKPNIVECQKAVETEEVILRQRCEKIKMHGLESLKQLRNKAVEVYLQLDEWINVRYKTEIETAKDLANLIKEAIEAEAKLPNLILLEGDRLSIDYSTLVLQPEPEPRPESPAEKPLPDQFTILQLRNIAKNLYTLAPSGHITVKCFTDFLTKTAIMSQSTDTLPEGYANADQSQIQQVLQILDPFDTGFVNWQKFLLFHARLLPVDESPIQEMYTAAQKLESYKNGVCSRDDFLKLRLWFEKEHSVVTKRTFDRAGKLKVALLDLFACPTEIPPQLAPPEVVEPPEPKDSPSTTPDLEEEQQPPIEFTPPGPSFNVKNFMLCCCSDEIAQNGLEKAFKVLQDENGQCTREQIISIFHHFIHVVPSSNRIDNNPEFENPYPSRRLHEVLDNAQLGDKIGLEQFTNTLQQSALAEWLFCPLYQLEDLTIGFSSRPSSGKQSAKNPNC